MHVLDRLLHGFLFLPMHDDSRYFGLQKVKEAIDYATLEVTKL